MAMSKGIQMKAALVLGLALFLYEVEGRASRGLASGGPAVFDVTKYGAKGDGKLEVGSEEDDYPVNSMAFIRAWLEACNSSGPAKVIIPPGKFVTGQIFFRGPCKSPAITVEVQGNLVPTSVPTYFPTPEWFHIYDVTGVTLTGTGTFDAQGREGSWNRYECLTNPNCAIPPPSISLYRVTNSVIDGIKSVNTLSYHIHVSDSRGVTIRNVNLHSPATHILTKGVDVLNSSDVNVVNSVIGAGNDCITFGRGSTNVSAVGITCGPGLGISVGNLGNEFGGADVKGVQVRNCTFRGTMNGARVRSLPGREPSKVSGIVFEDLVMDNVKNPIIIEEGNANQSSNAKISDVIFRNIKGTSATSSVVSFKCNKLFPCEGVQVMDVDVKPLAPGKQLPAAACSNTKVVFGGLHAGLAC